jgi:hypothetical protein
MVKYREMAIGMIGQEVGDATQLFPVPYDRETGEQFGNVTELVTHTPVDGILTFTVTFAMMGENFRDITPVEDET